MTGASPNVDLERTVFDVLVVGSGFGGGTTAYALSRAGLKVLLVERGGWPARDETDWNGRAILLEGRYKGETPIDVRQGGAGAGVAKLPTPVVGGNTRVLGGAALRHRAAPPRQNRAAESLWCGRHADTAECCPTALHAQPGSDAAHRPRSR